MKIIFILFSFYAFAALAETPNLAQVLRESQSLNWNQALAESVVIDASLNEVWKYASDSSQAKNWSVFFDHISTLPQSAPDGNPGSIRRCFRNRNEEGTAWDEMTIAVEPEVKRQIYVYHLVGFPFDFLAKRTHYFVLQLYEKIDETHTRLSFVTRPEAGSFASWVGALIGKSKTREIFKLNLENIKAAIEQKSAYVRPNAWK